MPKKSNYRWLRRALIYLGIAYLVILAGVAGLQGNLIFHPEKLPKDYQYRFSRPFEEHWIETADSARLNLLYFPVKQAKGSILYFHGNAGSLRRWGAIAAALTEQGYDVWVMDYRGYGKSTGKRSQQTLEADARRCYEFLQRRVPEHEIIVYGRSLGSHFASLVAAEFHPRLLLLETPFTSITDVASSYLPIIPVRWLLRYPLDNTALIKKRSCPLIVFHGTHDGVVPYELGKELFEAAPPPKQLVTVPGGDHHNLNQFPVFRRALTAALNPDSQ